jgi:hypothetical protein
MILKAFAPQNEDKISLMKKEERRTMPIHLVSILM